MRLQPPACASNLLHATPSSSMRLQPPPCASNLLHAPPSSSMRLQPPACASNLLHAPPQPPACASTTSCMRLQPPARAPCPARRLFRERPNAMATLPSVGRASRPSSLISSKGLLPTSRTRAASRLMSPMGSLSARRRSATSRRTTTSSTPPSPFSAPRCDADGSQPRTPPREFRLAPSRPLSPPLAPHARTHAHVRASTV